MKLIPNKISFGEGFSEKDLPQKEGFLLNFTFITF